MSTTNAAPESPLQAEALEVVPRIQRGLERVIASLPGPTSRPRDLVKLLGIHHSLAWKVLRVATGTEPLAIAQYIPGAAGIELFLDAASKQGVPEARLEEARRAHRKFRALIDEHAGDRPSLELMLRGLEPGRAAHAERRSLRRAAFLCNSSTWGVQIRTRFLSKIHRPGSQPGMMDIALVRGFLGVRRVRADAPLTLARVVTVDNDGVARRSSRSLPLDPDAANDDAPLVRRFCTNPLPEIRTVPGPGGVQQVQLCRGPVGERAAVNLCMAELQPNAAPARRDAHNTVSNTAVEVRSPIETLIIDLWAHQGTFAGMSPRCATYSELSGQPWYLHPAESLQQLPMIESVQTLGRGLSGADLADAPEYRGLMDWTFQRLAIDPQEYVLHRLRIEFPLIATAVVLSIDMPE